MSHVLRVSGGSLAPYRKGGRRATFCSRSLRAPKAGGQEGEAKASTSSASSVSAFVFWSRREVFEKLTVATLLNGVLSSDALAAKSGARGMARYIRRKDTNNIQPYVAEVNEAKQVVGGLVTDLLEKKDYEAARNALREGTFKTFRSAVRNIVDSDQAGAAGLTGDGIFRSLQELDASLAKEEETETVKQRVESFQAQTQQLIDSVTTTTTTAAADSSNDNVSAEEMT